MQPASVSQQRNRARIAGFLFLAAITLGVLAEFVAHGMARWGLRLGALACYVAVTVLFYLLFRSVHHVLAFTAAALSAALLVVAPFNWHPGGVDVGLACFGLSCLITAYLVFRSGFIPKSLAIPTVIAGIAWLTFLSRPLSRSVFPYNLAFGVLGQAILCLWLVVRGPTFHESAGWQ